ncbi:thiol reductant ABC exporter subunit CydD [Thermomonospora catenispora]|uniref:thiol reductant ABC exporter subunit CydD n=1 Tax=Thermomonospora catenispora TaxID=2493090 RepID=UPI00111FB7A7|nr:thiol reductant ABC exporter subunit CydD [Thermomonospora catenispora]TNY36614.1 thiol reductant ABC exporter subunit CydD [Thermomonospora catenispora]
MKPLDPRLLRHARPARTFLALTVLLGAVTTGLVLAQAALLAHVLAGSFDGRGSSELRTALGALLAVVAARALVHGLAEAAALHYAGTVRSLLRRRLVAHALRLGPQWTAGARAGEVATVATRGLDALDVYFARYLPQLVLACITPIAVLAVIAGADLLSAMVIAVTLPLIPVFMILVGLHTRARTERQWRLLERLGGHFLDVVEGLPTLKLFDRAEAQAKVIAEVTGAHRRVTMRVLRVAFLSAMVLELLSTLAVALVAVQVGLRLLGGDVPYETALLVLILAPEAYLPLRTVGAQFHAGMEGVAAAERAFEVLDTPPPRRPAPGGAVADLRRDPIVLRDVTVRHPERDRPALENVSLTIEPGERIVVLGPSGAGKSTLLSLLLRFVEPSAGTVGFADVPVEAWRAQISWVPQHPHLFDGTIADNIRLGRPDASPAEVRRAAARAGLAEFIASLPDGLDTRVGERGARLSSGQRQRVALARAFLRDAPLVLLDEPTAHLDPLTAHGVQETVHRLAAGRTVVLVTHDPTWTRLADRVVRIEAGRLTESPPPRPRPHRALEMAS